MVEPPSSSSSEVLLPSRCLYRAATALETCSSDSLDTAAAIAGDFAFFEPLLGAGDFALELLGAATGGAFFALDGAAAFAFLAPGTGAAAAGAAAASAILRFFGLPVGVGGADVAIVPDADGREALPADDTRRPQHEKKKKKESARWSDARRALLVTAPGDPGA
jgi:hypothetical protein